MHFNQPTSPFGGASLALALLLAATSPQPTSALPSGAPGLFGAPYNPAASLPNLTASDTTLFRPHSRSPRPDLTKRTLKRLKFGREPAVPLAKRGAPSCCGTFELAQSYAGSTFLDGFDFFTGADPTHGQVHYAARDEAASKGLTYTDASGATVLRVDSWNTLAAGAGRDSVRIESKQTIGIGSLVVMDVSKVSLRRDSRRARVTWALTRGGDCCGRRFPGGRACGARSGRSGRIGQTGARLTSSRVCTSE